MKTAIYYFSGTGNNLAVARQLKTELGEADVFPIRILAEQKSMDSSYTHVVLCTPSYYSHIPPIIREYLQGVSFTKEQKVISVVCCAGNRGRAVEDLRECVQACQKETTGEYMVVCSGSYILSYGAMPAFYQKLMKRSLHNKVHKIAKQIKQGTCTRLKKDGFLYRDKYETALQESIAKYGQIASEYTVSEVCKGCGICVQLCPVQNIHLEDQKPVFGTACQQCMACIQWCPQRAIDYQEKAHSRKQYHFSEISCKDMIEGNR